MRRPLPLTAALVSALALAGCGDDDPPAVTDPAAGDASRDSPVVEGAREIEVEGTSFAYDPDEIHVEVDEDVTIVLTSVDILHDFVVDEFGSRVTADVGETVAGGLRADEAGEFTFYCSIPGHREAGMEGTLVVE